MDALECTNLKGVNMPKNKQSKKRLSKELKEFFKTGDLQGNMDLYAIKGNIPELLRLWREYENVFMEEWHRTQPGKEPWIANFLKKQKFN